ncbi:hypothetical protein O181_049990 [Austropuccinia psidii MF-1]|uniref:Uncharacterized protein n=1 Tax=Austropuccinia psidii MF-1 TaxID=1389203 RepID=A0A9Q3E086_9BASI|nr:hypothetical protein [Austropuccinia psidii MF-1]
MLDRLNAPENQSNNKQTEVSTNLKNTDNTNKSPLSFAAVLATGTPRITNSLPKKPTPTTQSLTRSEQNKFKKFSIVIRTKFGATKLFEGKTTQESYKKS